MVRSESLKKAQKKYLAKIKEENTEVYKKIKKKHLEYQKDYLVRMKEDDNKYTEYKKCRASYAKTFYDKNKENILEKRLKLREIKKNKELELLLKKEIS